jgi:hypothetical protein
MTIPLTRITITIPGNLVRKADARAKREGRSRSWVLAEALRVFLEEPPRPSVVREAVVAPYVARPGLGDQRLELLKDDMRLTPVERLRNADASTEDAFRIHRTPRVPMVIAFERLEDYLAWKRKDLW